MIKKLLTGLAATALFALTPAHAQEMKEFNFGIISTESSQNLKTDWQPILDAMAKKTGMKINAFFASDYAGIIEGMRFNKVHAAWFGNKSAMEAVDRANGEVFAQMVNADGTQGYYSHLIVNKDSKLMSLDDMLKHGKDLAFGNGDPNSTSGFLVPSFYVFAQNHIDAKTFFKVARSANHESNALAVANKQVDVATNNSENLDKLKERMPEKFNQIRVIWTSPLIPLDPLVMRKDLPEVTKKSVKDFFYSYGTGSQQEKDVLMKLSKLSGFKASTNAQLTPIRQLELFKLKNKLEMDATLAASEKQTKIAEVDKQLAALSQ
ncbi:phosphonate ABC transporter substrate-binding protein [Rhodoferax antarcticus]|uniref:Putative phosphonate ABC transporter, periplasmic binding protein n=1 Tax=Rhodoferax antarcticus ANT.BR TaxID=1111071 RepID=A0A1Q8YJK8_9BURK|nr:phosphonate ABC transporter substrate-binding protein [Rhodoferax antarcticus]APW47708.1 phosphonate ABC transporter substrate-binding protein [Rhodoferax antarcticus]MCW2312528.1 phosphonate transport system substrate-binding protein [Rhodoferax antarcticus]OLP08238.1 putative phosphonate ABC transporter, periplasmic binding protein [Rhodoferax antarcticus ANT.BR]